MASLCVLGAPVSVSFPGPGIALSGGCINANYKDGQGNLVEVLDSDFTCEYIGSEMV